MATLLRKCSQLGKLGRIGSTLFPSFPAMLLCILCSEFTGANERETPNLGKNQSRTKWLQIERSSPRCLVVSPGLHTPCAKQPFTESKERRDNFQRLPSWQASRYLYTTLALYFVRNWLLERYFKMDDCHVVALLRAIIIPSLFHRKFEFPLVR